MMELIDVKRSLWGMQEARKKDGRDLSSRWLFLGLRGIFFTDPRCRRDDGGLCQWPGRNDQLPTDQGNGFCSTISV